MQWLLEPPDQDGLKTNFDGAMFHDLGEAGIGVVIRKNKGEVMSLMTAMSEKIPPTPLQFLKYIPLWRRLGNCYQFSLEE